MAESDLIRGNVDTIILKVLYEGDRYGYDLIRQINAKSDGAWEIKQPTVYACLKRLEKQGFVSSYWDSSESDGGRRKYYSLTDSGKEVFLQYKNEFERANALFGGIIMGSEPVYLQASDEFADVEEEGYSVPKRRAVRAKRPKPTKPEPTTVTDSAAVDEQAQELKEERDEPTPPAQQPQYVQPDLFSITEQANADGQAEQTETPEQPIQETLAARTAIDPRAIIDRYFAAERGESFSDVAGKTVYTEDRQSAQSARQQAVAAQPPAPVPVKQTPAPAPEKNIAENTAQQKTVAPPHRAVPPATIYAEDEESPARREYKTVLSDLVDRFEVAPPDLHDGAETTASEQAAADAYREQDNGRYYKIGLAASERGNDVKVRDHNDSAKEYAHKYYYYSNRLMMTHYTIMCPIMLLLGFVLFFTFHSGLGMRLKYDYLLYIGAGLLPIIMFIVAVIRFAGDPAKKKRVNVNFRLSIVIRLAIMVQVAVVIYCVNLIWGMPIAFSADYLPSLIIPLTYALFIPISEVIFMTLLNSEHYAAE